MKKAAKFIVCYFQVSFWCRTVEYSVTVICDWVLFHSNLIYINSSIGIPFTTVGFLSTQKSNNSCLNSSPHSVLSYSNFSLLLSRLVLSLGLSNSHCITFSTKITQNKPSESGKTNAERSMVAVTRSVKIYFQTPWILAQYTFDFPLARFFFTHRVLMLVRVLSRFLSLSRSLSISFLLLLALNILACSTFIVYFKLYLPPSVPLRACRLCLYLSMNAFWSFQFWYKVDM